jgi:uncharacterized protein (DUF305 family)
MRISHTIAVMFVGSFLIQYFVMNAIMTNTIGDFTNSVGKAYMAVIMALNMVALEVMMHDRQYSVISTKTYCIVFGLLAVFIYLYRKQVGIRDKEYLKGMIEHHSMALLTSKRILEKSDDYNVAKLAKNIIEKQEEEIQFMRNTL